jgi:MerR family transcriptional regulator, light-induced transcriptional regulator
MNNKFTQFMHAFNNLEKTNCVNMVYQWLEEGQITIIELYEDILVEALAYLTDVESNPNHKIWFEHIQSSIVRTIIEMAHPFVLKEKKEHQSNLKAAVLCPDGEQHELGARMINDYLVLSGVDSYFVGRDTPRKEFVDMINVMNLDLVAISVTNYYNTSEVSRTVDLIKAHNKDVDIIVGGRAVMNNLDTYKNNTNIQVVESTQALFGYLERAKK